MSDPANRRWVHPDTGETVENVTDPREQAGLAEQGFRLAEGDAVMHVVRSQGGQPTLVPIRARDIERVLEQDGSIRFFERGRDAHLFDQAIEQGRQQVLENFTGTSFAMGLADPLSLGLAPLLRGISDPNSTRTGAEIVGANPGAHLAGTILSFAPALAGGGASAGSRLLGSLGLAGAARGAGTLAGRGAASLAARAGLRSATAQRLSRIASVLTEESAMGVGLEGVLAAQQDRPFLAENAAVDAGLGVGLMLGIGGLGAGRAALGTRFLNRAEGTPGGRMATEGVRYATDVVDGRRAYSDVVAMQQAPAPGQGLTAAAIRTIGGQEPGVANVMTHRRFREMAVAAPEVIRREANGLADDLENLGTLQREMTVPAFDQSWVRRHTDELLTRPGAAQAAVLTRAQGIDEVIEGYFDPRAPRALSRDEADALRRMRGLVRSLDTMAKHGATIPELFERVVSFKGVLNAEDLGGTGLLAADAAESIRAMAWDALAWGSNVARTQHTRDIALRDLKNGHDAAMASMGRTARLGDDGRVPSPAAVAREMRKASDEMMETVVEAEEAIALYADAARRLSEVSGEAVGPQLQALAQSALRHMDQGAAHARAARLLRDAEKVETTRHGALSLFGVGLGGALGLVIGGPAGWAIGAMTGLPFAVFGRPVGTLTRFDALRRGNTTTAARVEAGYGRVRTAMSSGPQRADLARGAARGVQLYYNLNNPETRVEEFMVLRHDLLEVAENPTLLQDRLAYTTAAYHSVSPELGDAVAYAWATQLQHLLEHMPQPIVDPLTGQVDEGIAPSEEGVSVFARRYSVVEDPYIVLDRLASGRLHPNEMDTLRACHPSIFATLANDIAGIVADVGTAKVPYEMKLQLDTFFGYPTHATLQPGFLLAMQGARAMTAPSSQASALGGRPLSTSARYPQAVQHTQTRIDTLLR